MKAVTTDYGSFEYFPLDCIGNIISKGAFWDECLRPYMDKLTPGEVFVDVGANIGFFPVYLGRRNVTCYAFEASPEVYNVLVHNVELNNLTTKIATYNQALYSSECDLVLHNNWRAWAASTNGKPDYDKSGNCGWLCLVPKGNGDDCVVFHARTLDSFELSDVRLLKIDVQGCDLEVLKGAVETIGKYKPIVLFEYEDFVSIAHGDTWDKYEDFFKAMHYSIRKIGSVEYIAEPRS